MILMNKLNFATFCTPHVHVPSSIRATAWIPRGTSTVWFVWLFDRNTAGLSNLEAAGTLFIMRSHWNTGVTCFSHFMDYLWGILLRLLHMNCLWLLLTACNSGFPLVSERLLIITKSLEHCLVTVSLSLQDYLQYLGSKQHMPSGTLQGQYPLHASLQD